MLDRLARNDPRTDCTESQSRCGNARAGRKRKKQREKSMGVIANHERFHSLTEALARHAVEACLPYPGMVDLPAGYSRFAETDATRRELVWEDVCPAYALAAITEGAYRLPDDAQAMETLWDELGGASTRLWPEIEDVVHTAWDWLARHR
jgi:hypothetical protein